MFTLSAAIWVSVVVAAIGLSVKRPATSALADRYASPLYWVALVAATVAGAAPLIAPAVDLGEGPSAFSVERASAHIDQVAKQPHPMGSAAIDEVRNYLAEQIRDLGLDAEFQAVTAPDYYGTQGKAVSVVNVVARIEGTASTGSVALVGHYDTVPETPGANDNSSGVAILLETARVLRSGAALRNDVILVFTDGEEPAPRYGSTPFVDDHRWSDEIRFVVNLEAIGTSGPSMLTETNGPQSWVIDHYANAAPQPVAYSFLTSTMALIGGSNTDFAPFRDAGVPGVEFVYTRGSPVYHTAADSADSVSLRSLQSHGRNTVELVRHLAGEDLSSPRGDDTTFFTIGRYHLVQYPEWWAVPLVGLTGLALFAAVKRRKTWSTMVRDSASASLIAVLATIVATVLWAFLAGWRSRMEIVESYIYLCGLGSLAVLAMLVPMVSRPGVGLRIAPEGVVFVWWLLGLLTALTVPGMSYLFALPALAGAVALALEPSSRSRWARLAAGATTVGIAIVLLLPAIDTFFQFAQPRPGNPDSEILLTIAVPVLLTVLVAQLALSFRPNAPELSQ